VIVQIEAKLNEKNIPRNMIGREKRVVALEQYLSQARNYDPVLDGLRSAVRYDKTYFDKIVASLLPLLEKLTSGKIAQLLAPNYSDLADPRPIFDWMQVIRKRAIVYVGWMRCPTPRSPQRSATRCSAISCRSPGTSTSTGSTTACRAHRLARACRSTSMRTNSMN
jgi:hypothetical protein